MGVVVAAALAPAHASLIGDTVQGCFTNPNFQSFFPAVCANGFSGGGAWDPSYPSGPVEQSNPVSAVVGGGVEFDQFQNFGSFTIDTSANFAASSLTIAITESISDSWGQLIFAFRLPDLISNVTLQGSSLPVANITFDAHQIFLLINGFGMSAGQTRSATFDITAEDVVVATPEPATLGLIGLGLAGVGALRQRSRSCRFEPRTPKRRP